MTVSELKYTDEKMSFVYINSSIEQPLVTRL